MQKFLIEKENIVNARAEILGQDARHICKVLRLGKQDSLHLTDGLGTDYTGLIIHADPSRILIQITGQTRSLVESPLWITLCSGMLKHQKMDQIIKATTQLGICEWIPFFCERSIPLPDAKGLQKRKARWEAIAKESIKQCRRSRLVRVAEPVNLQKILDRSSSFDLRIAFWEKSDKRLTDPGLLQARGTRIMILIGPEGGFSKNEISQAQSKGFQSYSLGPRILRAETASTCACTLVQHILGDI